MLAKYSDELLELAVKGMLPKNRLSRRIITKLHVYKKDVAITTTLNKNKKPSIKLSFRACSRNGSFFRLDCPDGLYRLYGGSGEFLALARVAGGTCRTIKSFFEV